MIRLTVTREDGREAVYEFDRDEVLIGRAEPADLILDHDAVSRRHARLSLKSQGWRVADLGAANGVFLQRRGEPPAVRVIVDQLNDGDVVCIERYRLRFEHRPDEKARHEGQVEGEQHPPRNSLLPTQLISLSAIHAARDAEHAASPAPAPEQKLAAALALSLGDPVGGRSRTDPTLPLLRRELEVTQPGQPPLKLALSAAPLQFGSDPSCDVVIKGLTVPRFACSVELDGDRALVRRLGAGLMGPPLTVDGRKVKEAHLGHGGRFQLGALEAVVQLPRP